MTKTGGAATGRLSTQTWVQVASSAHSGVLGPPPEGKARPRSGGRGWAWSPVPLGPTERRPSEGLGVSSQLVTSKGNNLASLPTSLTRGLLVYKVGTERTNFPRPPPLDCSKEGRIGFGFMVGRKMTSPVGLGEGNMEGGTA